VKGLGVSRGGLRDHTFCLEMGGGVEGAGIRFALPKIGGPLYIRVSHRGTYPEVRGQGLGWRGLGDSSRGCCWG